MSLYGHRSFSCSHMLTLCEHIARYWHTKYPEYVKQVGWLVHVTIKIPTSVHVKPLLPTWFTGVLAQG